MIAINIIGLIFQVECIEYCGFYHIIVATTNNKGYQHVSTTGINMTCLILSHILLRKWDDTCQIGFAYGNKKRLIFWMKWFHFILPTAIHNIK